MSARDEAGLRRLQHALDEAQWPSPELLARYASEPNRLSEAEKLQVERAISTSPVVADELATLRGFDFTRLDADRRSAEVGAREGKGWLAWLRALGLDRTPLQIAVLAAIVALAFGLTRLNREGSDSASPGAPPQIAERSDSGTGRAGSEMAGTEVAGTDEPAAPTPTAPVAPEIAPAEIAVAEAPIAGADPKTAPDPLEANGDALASDAPRDVLPDSPDGSAQEKVAEAPEILLAMAMPEYRPAFGLDDPSAGEWIVRGDAGEEVRITLLSPAHVVRSCSASPTLYWSLDRLPESGSFFLTIVDANDEPIVLDRPIARPARSGRQRLDLGAQGLRLPADQPLRWSIALRDDESAAPRAFDLAWLRVSEPAATEKAALEVGGAGGRSAAFAGVGCYAEAIAAAIEAQTDRGNDPAPARALDRLAEQAGLDPKLLRE